MDIFQREHMEPTHHLRYRPLPTPTHYHPLPTMMPYRPNSRTIYHFVGMPIPFVSGDGQSAVSLSVSVSLFWRENDADNPAKRLSASFFCAGLLPVITPHPGTLHSPRWLPSSQVAKPQLLQPRRVFPKGKRA